MWQMSRRCLHLQRLELSLYLFYVPATRDDLIGRFVCAAMSGWMKSTHSFRRLLLSWRGQVCHPRHRKYWVHRGLGYFILWLNRYLVTVTDRLRCKNVASLSRSETLCCARWYWTIEVLRTVKTYLDSSFVRCELWGQRRIWREGAHFRKNG